MTEPIYDVVAKEIELPIDCVHPDPFQPRVHPDAELADSIKSQGILQAIRVEEFIKSLSQGDAEKLASAYAAYEAGAIKLPDIDQERKKLATSLRSEKFALPDSALANTQREVNVEVDKIKSRQLEGAIA